jgi:hypothetical protein
MRRPAALLSVCFCAGLLGALIGIGAVSVLEMLGLPDLSAYVVRPLLSPGGFYPRLVWGGLWGLLFFLTIGSVRTRRHWIQKGVLVSMVPTLLTLILYLPEQTGSTPKFFLAAPATIILLNLIWGVFTGLFSRLLWGRN